VVPDVGMDHDAFIFMVMQSKNNLKIEKLQCFEILGATHPKTQLHAPED
jgi:hypothetical protein